MHLKRLCSGKRITLLTVYALFVHNLVGQLVEKPVGFPFPYKSTQAARTLAVGDTIALPFWDDFSTTLGRPSTEWWAYGEDVFVNRTLGQHPPTLGVATFDGVNRLGVPHNANSNFVGPADSLISKAIDLSGIPANIRSTVYLSFFWQIKGLGEVPNREDSLRLQFFNRDRQWVTQWVLHGGEDNLNENFTHAFIAITDPAYYHEGFRFKFQSFNKQTGPFDHWHIDYVYLNQGRNSEDNTFFDRALSTSPSTPLSGLYALPADQLKSSAGLLNGGGGFEIYNLDALLQPVEYNLKISEPVTGATLWIDQDRVVDPIPQGLERRSLTSSPIDAQALAGIVGERDSVVMDLQVFLKTGDRNLISRVDPLTADTTYFDNVNFRNNDTTTIKLTFHDYTAYDDGTAEYAAGINQSRGQLAYKVAALAQDTLTGVDIYFPRIAPFAEGQPLDILAWKTLTNVNPTLLVSQRVSIQYTDSLDKFVRYKFEVPVVVRDSFFIGYRQYTDNFVGIGLDKNNNSGNRVFYNTGNGWVQNDRTEGSLMIRPVFEKTDAMPVTGVNEDTKPQPLVYPNPSSGVIYIPVKPESVQVSDLSGKVVYREMATRSAEPFEIDLTRLPKGIYFVHYIYRNRQHTFKLLLTD